MLTLMEYVLAMCALSRTLRSPVQSASGSSVNHVALDERSPRARETAYTSPLAPPSSLTIPHKRRGFFVPPFHGLLQPVDDLLGALRMLAGQSAGHNDALHRLGHVEPRAAHRRVERHHPMCKEPAHQVMRHMPGQVIQDQDDA